MPTPDSSAYIKLKRLVVVGSNASTKGKSFFGNGNYQLGQSSNGLSNFLPSISKANKYSTPNLLELFNNFLSNSLINPAFFTKLDTFLCNQPTSKLISLPSPSLLAYYSNKGGLFTTALAGITTVYALTSQNIGGLQTFDLQAIKSIPPKSALLLPVNYSFTIPKYGTYTITNTNPAKVSHIDKITSLLTESILPAHLIFDGMSFYIIGTGSSAIIIVDGVFGVVEPIGAAVTTIAGDGTYNQLTIKDGCFESNNISYVLGSTMDTTNNILYFTDGLIEEGGNNGVKTAYFRSLDLTNNCITTKTTINNMCGHLTAIPCFYNGCLYTLKPTVYSEINTSNYIVLSSNITSFSYVYGDLPRIINYNSSSFISCSINITLPDDWGTNSTNKYRGVELLRIYNNVGIWVQISHTLNGVVNNYNFSTGASINSTTPASISIFRPDTYESSMAGLMTNMWPLSLFKYSISTATFTNLHDFFYRVNGSLTPITIDKSTGDIYISTDKSDPGLWGRIGYSCGLFKFSSTGVLTTIIRPKTPVSYTHIGDTNVLEPFTMTFLNYYSGCIYYVSTGPNFGTCVFKYDLATNSASLYAGTFGFSGTPDNLPSWLGGSILASNFKIGIYISMTINSIGELIIYDFFRASYYKINTSGNISLFAGPGIPDMSGYLDGPITSALFSGGYAISVDSMDNVYFADIINGFFRKIDIGPGGVGCPEIILSTIATESPINTWTLNSDLSISSCQCLTIPPGNTLVVPFGISVSNNGLISNESSFINRGTIVNTGVIEMTNTNGILYNCNGGNIDNTNGTIQNINNGKINNANGTGTCGSGTYTGTLPITGTVCPP